ncbi:hypothetical protein [Bacillus infantis]|uniref:hypothetical protein n=1 Tax=Bacillus infantis TaxID=324767 RepID=UPI00165349E5|nr:hypothetical protein [Bacillus infantis]
MIYEVKLLMALRSPGVSLYQLEKAEDLRGLRKRIWLLAILSSIIYAISSYFGIGTEFISKELSNLSAGEFEARKGLFVLGKAVWGLLYAAIYIFLPALYFWTLTDLEYKKLLVVQLFAFSILLIEKALLIPISLTWGISPSSSPFSLGILAQYATSNGLIVHFLGAITLFQVWIIYVQTYWIKKLTGRKGWVIFLIVLSLHIVFWILTALGTHIKMEKIF